jgi:hypothetical protein
MPACHAGDRRFDPGRDRHFHILVESNEPIGFVFLFFYGDFLIKYAFYGEDRKKIV